MPAKRANLAEVFKENAAKQQPKIEVVDPAPAASPKKSPARANKKHIGGYFDEAVYRQLKHIGIEKGMTTQQILAEAINAFFERNDHPPIA